MPTSEKQSQNFVKQGDSREMNEVENTKWHAMAHLHMSVGISVVLISIYNAFQVRGGEGFELQLSKTMRRSTTFPGKRGKRESRGTHSTHGEQQHCEMLPTAAVVARSSTSEGCILLSSAVEQWLQGSQGSCDRGKATVSWATFHISDPPSNVSSSHMLAYLIITIGYKITNNLA